MSRKPGESKLDHLPFLPRLGLISESLPTFRTAGHFPEMCSHKPSMSTPAMASELEARSHGRSVPARSVRIGKGSDQDGMPCSWQRSLSRPGSTAPSISCNCAQDVSKTPLR